MPITSKNDEHTKREIQKYFSLLGDFALFESAIYALAFMPNVYRKLISEPTPDDSLGGIFIQFFTLTLE